MPLGGPTSAANKITLSHVTVPVLVDPSPQLMVATYCSSQLTSILLPVSVNVATRKFPVLSPSWAVAALPLSGATVMASGTTVPTANAAPLWSTTSAEAVAAAIPTYANDARIDRP